MHLINYLRVDRFCQSLFSNNGGEGREKKPCLQSP